MSIRSAFAGAAATVLVAGGAFAFAATSNASEPAVAPAVASVKAMTQDDYLSTIKGLMVGRGGVTQTDADYVASGRSVCSDLTAGQSWSDVVSGVRSIDGDITFYRPAYVASVATFCPENAWRLSR